MPDTSTNVTTSSSVTYSSNKPSVATVDHNGTVHAVASGSAVVTAHYSKQGAVAHKSVSVAVAGHGNPPPAPPTHTVDPTPGGTTNWGDGIAMFTIDTPMTVTAIRIYLQPVTGTRPSGIIGFVANAGSNAWNGVLSNFVAHTNMLAYAVIPAGEPAGWNTYVLNTPAVLAVGGTVRNGLLCATDNQATQGPHPQMIDISSTRANGNDSAHWHQAGGITQTNLISRRNNFFDSNIYFGFTFSLYLLMQPAPGVVGSVEGQAALTAGKPQAQLFTVNETANITRVGIVRPKPAPPPATTAAVLGTEIVQPMGADFNTHLTVPVGTELILFFVGFYYVAGDYKLTVGGKAATQVRQGSTPSSYGFGVGLYSVANPATGVQVLGNDRGGAGSPWCVGAYAVYCTGSLKSSVVGVTSAQGVLITGNGSANDIMVAAVNVMTEAGFPAIVAQGTTNLGIIQNSAGQGNRFGIGTTDGNDVASWWWTTPETMAYGLGAVITSGAANSDVAALIGASGCAWSDHAMYLPSGCKVGDLAVIIMFQDNANSVPANVVTPLGYGTLVYSAPAEGGNMAGARLCVFTYRLLVGDITTGYLSLPTLTYTGTTSGPTLTVFRGCSGVDVANIVKRTGDNMIEASTTPSGRGFLIHCLGSQWTPPAPTPDNLNYVANGRISGTGRYLTTGVSSYESGPSGGYTWQGTADQMQWAGGAAVVPVLIDPLAPTTGIVGACDHQDSHIDNMGQACLTRFTVSSEVDITAVDMFHANLGITAPAAQCGIVLYSDGMHSDNVPWLASAAVPAMPQSAIGWHTWQLGAPAHLVPGLEYAFVSTVHNTGACNRPGVKSGVIATVYPVIYYGTTFQNGMGNYTVAFRLRGDVGGSGGGPAVDTDLSCPIGIAPVFSNTDTVPWLGKGLITADSTGPDGWCVVTLDHTCLLTVGEFYSLVCTATSALSGSATNMERFGCVATAYEMIFCGIDESGSLLWDYDAVEGETTDTRLAFRLMTG